MRPPPHPTPPGDSPPPPRPQPSRIGTLHALWVGLNLAMMPLGGPAAEPPPAPVAPSLRREWIAPGRYVFERHCVLCHGRRGNGKGELASTTVPRPRDFTRGLFKYRSTPSGHLPTDEDLTRTIQGGLTGTAMPAFTQLPDRDVRSVIEYLKTLSPRWTNAVFQAPAVEVPTAPDWLADPTAREPRLIQGRRLFAASCAPCHGEDGAGLGPASAALTDAWGHPCPPRDLRAPLLRVGNTPEDLHRILLTGLDGTPMPSFAEVTTPEDRWDLVAFILHLRQTPATAPGPK